jgi:hypothetical protein
VLRAGPPRREGGAAAGVATWLNAVLAECGAG